MWNRFKTFDPLLYLLPLILIAISVTVIYGLTYGSVGAALAVRQGIFALGGLVLMVLLTFLDYRMVRGWWLWIYGGGILTLIAVEVMGVEVFGATRWIDIGFFQFQPGELEKAVVVIGLAAWLARTVHMLRPRDFWISAALLLIPTAMVLLQPDLGTALVIITSGLTLLFHAPLARWQRFLLIGAVVGGFTIGVLSLYNVAPFSGVLKDYQKDRLVSFIDPDRDAQGSGYNVLQSKIAVGSGGLLGKGLGYGSQSQLHFLPVAHADFIFAGIAEAWGLVGAMGIIGLYAVLISRLIVAARIAKDRFGMYVIIGIVAKLLFEVLVNIGMNIGIMPVTGIPLPFLSYGGTTLITNLMLIGIAQSIVVRYKRLTF